MFTYDGNKIWTRRLSLGLLCILNSTQDQHSTNSRECNDRDNNNIYIRHNIYKSADDRLTLKLVPAGGSVFVHGIASACQP